MRIFEIEAAERRADALKVNAVAAKAKETELAAQADLAMVQVQQRELKRRKEAGRRRTLQALKPTGPQ